MHTTRFGRPRPGAAVPVLPAGVRTPGLATVPSPAAVPPGAMPAAVPPGAVPAVPLVAAVPLAAAVAAPRSAGADGQGQAGQRRLTGRASAGVRWLLAVLAAAVLVLLPGTPAWAHNQLIRTEPDRNATVAKAPASVVLTFLERLNPQFTAIVVSDAAGHRVAAGPLRINAETGTLPLDEPLHNGVYTVAYRVVSLDGHTVQNSFTFTMADPALPPAAAIAPKATGTKPGGSAGLPTGVLIALVAIGVVLVGCALYLYFSRRRSPAGRVGRPVDPSDQPSVPGGHPAGPSD